MSTSTPSAPNERFFEAFLQQYSGEVIGNRPSPNAPMRPIVSTKPVDYKQEDCEWFGNCRPSLPVSRELQTTVPMNQFFTFKQKPTLSG